MSFLMTSDSGLSGLILLTLVKRDAAVPSCFNHHVMLRPCQQVAFTEGITLDRCWGGHSRIFIGFVQRSKPVMISDHSDSMNRHT